MGRKIRKAPNLEKKDPKYKSEMLARFINLVMLDGKKTKALNLVYDALSIVKERLDKNPVEAFEEAINNVKPLVEIKSRRIGGDTYQIPVRIEGRRSETLAFRWINAAARAKKGKSYSDYLAEEIINAFNKEGTAMERRRVTHRMAEANKAFAHFG